MNILTVQQLKKMNSSLIKLSVPHISEKTLTDILNSAFAKESIGFYRHRFIAEKAAVLGCGIVEKTPFKDKNDQTAVLAMLTLLDINGIGFIEGFEKDAAELPQLMRGDDAFEKTLAWINAHIRSNYYYKPIP